MPRKLRSGGGLGDNVYDGAATFGRFMATLWLIVGNVLAIVLLGFGIYLLASKGTYSQSTMATIREATCEQVVTKTDKGQTVLDNCVLKLEYIAGDKTIEKLHPTQGRIYTAGQTLAIRYNPAHPEDFTTGHGRGLLGGILLGIGLFFLIASWIYWWIVSTYKFAAAAQGVGSAYDLAT